MRLYVKRMSNKSVWIAKESVLQSILSDLITMIVMAFLIALDLLFCYLVRHSFIIDIAVVVAFAAYLSSWWPEKRRIMTAEEAREFLEEFMTDIDSTETNNTTTK